MTREFFLACAMCVAEGCLLKKLFSFTTTPLLPQDMPMPPAAAAAASCHPGNTTKRPHTHNTPTPLHETMCCQLLPLLLALTAFSCHQPVPVSSCPVWSKSPPTHPPPLSTISSTTTLMGWWGGGRREGGRGTLPYERHVHGGDRRIIHACAPNQMRQWS